MNKFEEARKNVNTLPYTTMAKINICNFITSCEETLKVGR